VVSVPAAQSGRGKCPYDPTSIYAVSYVESGNPFNLPSLYTAVATDSNSGYVVINRPSLPLNNTNSYTALVNLLRTDTDPKWINTAEAAYVVAVIDIGPYVYYFFRELALESTAFCGKTYYSRVARVCKTDEGGTGLNMEYRFTSFLKARLICSVVSPSSSVPYHFNEVYDVQYNSSSSVFHILFMANSNRQWGSAVCAYSLNDINNVFDHGTWIEQARLDTAWLRVPDQDVPVRRPGQCSDDSKNYDTSTLSFIKSHPLMLDYVEPEGGSPVYYSKDLAFSRLAVDHLQTCTVLYLYLPDGDAVHKVVSSVSSSSTSGQSPYFSYYTVSVWKPFVGLPLAMPHDIPSTVWSLKFHSVNKKKWLYVTSDAAIVELNPDQCTLYKFCTDCVRDPYCGWNVAVNSCQSFTPGLLQSTSQSESLTVCQSSCVRKYVHASVVAGMSLHLSCSSNCHPDGDIRWMFSNNAAGISPRAVPVGTDADYVLSRDGGLVILVTKAAVHAGTFFCTYNDVVLAEHQVAMSGCEYGENVRDILTKEYVRWCKTFDSYNTEYQTWLCMKKKCLESNCVPNISECK
jgi:hypothetical protein